VLRNADEFPIDQALARRSGRTEPLELLVCQGGQISAPEGFVTHKLLSSQASEKLPGVLRLCGEKNKRPGRPGLCCVSWSERYLFILPNSIFSVGVNVNGLVAPGTSCQFGSVRLVVAWSVPPPVHSTVILPLAFTFMLVNCGGAVS